MGYDTLESNALFLGSNPVVVILIQCNYIRGFPVNLLPNFVNTDKKICL